MLLDNKEFSMRSEVGYRICRIGDNGGINRKEKKGE